MYSNLYKSEHEWRVPSSAADLETVTVALAKNNDRTWFNGMALRLLIMEWQLFLLSISSPGRIHFGLLTLDTSHIIYVLMGE